MPNQPPPQPTLYERLGGAFSIATVVDDLIDRVMTDARLNANPAGRCPGCNRRVQILPNRPTPQRGGGLLERTY